MRKVLIALAAASSVVAITPAAAHPQDRGYGHGWEQGRHHGGSQLAHRNAERQIMRDLDRLQDRIDRSRRIDRRDAFQLQRETNQVRQLFFRYSRNGLSQRQFVELRQRIDQIEQRLRWAERRR